MLIVNISILEYVYETAYMKEILIFFVKRIFSHDYQVKTPKLHLLVAARDSIYMAICF